MTLPAAARFGPYEVVAPIGAGGMGEVYRARDTRLNRDVAIKILPASIASHPKRRARFEREARAISRLNHPNICTLYDVGTEDGIAYLVMEYIDGESLAHVLRRGALPTPTALRLAIQIVAALDAAHRRGIVHRDLKPANVIVADQTVKLVDFGLAKLHADGEEGETTAVESTLSLTAERSLIGTLHYMAPEQLQGRDVDARVDIFAFGAVLYEMLTGRKAFDGATDASVIAAIMTAEQPPLSSSVPAESAASPAVDHLVRRALAKNADERWQTARDLMNELQWILEPGSRPVLEVPSRLRRRRIAGPGLAVAALLAGIVAAPTVWRINRAALTPIHLSFTRPFGLEFTNTGRPVLAISPDGRKVVFNANNQLYIRSLDGSEAVPIPGTQGIGVQTPLFSPDGRWVAFFSAETRELKKVPVDGGAATTIAQSPTGTSAGNFGASWTASDQILFATTTGVFRVSANGGTPQNIVEALPGETLYGPQMLPDGDRVLLTVTTASGIDRWDKALILAQSISTGARSVLINGGADARYLETGHIVYAVGTTMFAVPIDVRTPRILGPPVTVVRDVRRAVIPAVNTASAFAAISKSGDLVYIPAADESVVNVLVDMSGRVAPLPDPEVRAVRVSPDGSRMVAIHGDAWWIYSLTRRAAPTRIAAAEGANVSPLWTPDGSRVVFRSREESGFAIVSRRAEGAGPEEILLPVGGYPVGWSRDGRTLFYMFERQLWSWTRGEQARFVASINAPYASVSPDRQWVAFHTYEGGRPVPYIQSMSNASARYRISENGGHAPLWSPDGAKLFYVHGETNSLIAVDVQTTPTVAFGDPVVLVPEIRHGLALDERRYDITPDGRQLLVPVRDKDKENPQSREVHVVLNWLEDMKRRVPRS